MLKILPNFNHTTPTNTIYIEYSIYARLVLTIILRGDIQRMKSVRSPVGSLLRPIAFDPWRVGYGRARSFSGSWCSRSISKSTNNGPFLDAR